MILTVTPNPALDITYRLGGGLRVGQTNRVLSVSERAGGKGLNVARVLAAHGVGVVALGLLGGGTGDAVRGGLDAAGVAHDFTMIGGVTRRTVVVSSEDAAGLSANSDGATGLWEPGPSVTGAEWQALLTQVRAYLDRASVVVLAGSLPPGAPVTGYAELIRLARAARVPVVLDADGDALRHGLAAGPTVAKPNAAELTAVTGHPVSDVDSAIAAIRANLDSPADLVVSLGPAGLLAVTSAGTWSARPPATYHANATGAGDAAVAALALGLLRDSPWPTRLAHMIAWSAAAAAHPVAGELDPALAADLHLKVVVAECASP